MRDLSKTGIGLFFLAWFVAVWFFAGPFLVFNTAFDLVKLFFYNFMLMLAGMVIIQIGRIDDVPNWGIASILACWLVVLWFCCGSFLCVVVSSVAGMFCFTSYNFLWILLGMFVFEVTRKNNVYF